LVKLAAWTKRKVAEVIKDCPFEMSVLHTQTTLNFLPPGSYDVMLGMDWLAVHKAKSNCYENTLECEDEEENTIVLQGIRKPVLVRKILALQLKKFSRKGCPLYAIQVSNSAERKELKVEDHPMLWEYKDVFLEEVHGLPPKRDLDFSIDLLHGVVPTSKVPYKISTLELAELKVQLKEMLDKGYTRLSVTPQG
jgi:hypothetical protein